MASQLWRVLFVSTRVGEGWEPSPTLFQLNTLRTKTLLASVNSGSFIIWKPRVDLKCLLSPNLTLFNVLLE